MLNDAAAATSRDVVEVNVESLGHRCSTGSRFGKGGLSPEAESDQCRLEAWKPFCSYGCVWQRGKVSCPGSLDRLMMWSKQKSPRFVAGRATSAVMTRG